MKPNMELRTESSGLVLNAVTRSLNRKKVSTSKISWIFMIQKFRYHLYLNNSISADIQTIIILTLTNQNIVFVILDMKVQNSFDNFALEYAYYNFSVSHQYDSLVFNSL